MKNFLQTVSADDRIRAFIYFKYYQRRAGESHWRLVSDPKTLEVFRGWAR